MVDKNCNLNLLENKTKKVSGKGSNQDGKVRGTYSRKGSKKEFNDNKDYFKKAMEMILLKLDRIAKHLKIEDWNFEDEGEDIMKNKKFVKEFMSLWKKFNNSQVETINAIRNSNDII